MTGGIADSGNRATQADHNEHHEDRILAERQSQELDRRVTRKLDAILLPFLALFFLVNSLDRSNVGNAETAQFTRDAGLEPGDLNTAVALFFSFFVALQPVGAACGRRFGMRRWVPSCMLIWGFCTALHVWVTQKWQLYSLRILIGILEAGFYPTTVAYMSLFYTRFEFGRRLGVFYGQYAIAGALGGCLSYLVFSRFPSIIEEARSLSSGWKSWQVLFLLEGGLTVIIAAIGFFWLPDNAETAWFLRQSERKYAGYRIWRDRVGNLSLEHSTVSTTVTTSPNDQLNDEPTLHQGIDANSTSNDNGDNEEEAAHLLPGHTPDTSLQARSKPALSGHFTGASGLTTRDVLDAFLDWKVFYLLLLNILSAIPAAAFGVFLPLVVQGLGFKEDAASANLLTAPPFLVGAVVLFVFVWWSDVKRKRLEPILYGLGILLTGLTATVLIPHHYVVLRYISLCVLLGGSFIASPLTIAWLGGNIEEPGKRSVVFGINGWGNLAGVFSSLLFSKQFAPHYALPFFVTLVCVLCAFIGYLVFQRLLVLENKWRASVVASWNDADIETEKKWGKGPLDTVSPWRQALYRKSRLLQQVDSTWNEAATSSRRGEEKLTFRYGF